MFLAVCCMQELTRGWVSTLYESLMTSVNWERVEICRGECTVRVQGAGWAGVGVVYVSIGSKGAVAMAVADAIHGA